MMGRKAVSKTACEIVIVTPCQWNTLTNFEKSILTSAAIIVVMWREKGKKRV
jgi:hypothetical protein